MRLAGLVATAVICGLFFGVGLSAQEGLEQPEGHIHVDVVVTDAAGKPVNGLQKEDFKLLDDGKERSLASFAAYDGLHAKADPPVQMILVIDCVNNGFVELSYIRQGLTRFLRQNDGRLAQPTTLVRFSLSGAQTLSNPTTDGNALAGVVNQIGVATKPKGIDDYSLSLNVLSTIISETANEPGRKMLIWLGPGWPTPLRGRQVFTSLDERYQHADYRLIVQYAKAMEEGRIVLYGGYEGADFYMRDFLKPVRKISEADPHDLALEVLALKSGGHGELSSINRDSAVTDLLNELVAEAGTFYSLTFDPPRAKGRDDFHDLRVRVDKPGLTVRAIAGYYDEPEYYPAQSKGKPFMAQQPAREQPRALRPVTVVQLTEIVGQVKSGQDSEAAKGIEDLQLTERLSTSKLIELSRELPGSKSRAALTAVGDTSVFLDPPKSEMPKEAVPEMAEQKQMMSRVVDYLKNNIPNLPNFYARRFTTSFERVWAPEDVSGPNSDGPLHPAGTFRAIVYYRGGQEVARAEGAVQHGLITRGTFGPILSTVVVDAARSNTTHWSRWEEGPNGPMAVFRFQVSQKESHYQISGSENPGGMDPTAYHGEIGIDPSSGTIQRLVLEADPELGSSLQRADIMVEYGAVAIGGKTYTCPVRSVSYSVGSLDVPTAIGVAWMREAARLNDVIFNDYHVFRSDFKIVPYTP